tara:strand:- start:625 stop:882 length:258 start_codon:yes stop_codon:yes gene_type:complete
MTEEIALWAIGIMTAPAIVGGFYTVNGIRELLSMHRNPERTGFGTVGMHEVINRNSDVIQDLTHYMKWVGEQQTGQKPPPPISGS